MYICYLVNNRIAIFICFHVAVFTNVYIQIDLWPRSQDSLPLISVGSSWTVAPPVVIVGTNRWSSIIHCSKESLVFFSSGDST